MGGGPVHCGNILALYPTDISIQTPHHHDNQKMSLVIDKYLPPPGGGELIPAVNHWCAVLTGIYLVLRVFKALLETHYIYDLIELLK